MVEVRNITEDEFHELRKIVSQGFGHDPRPEEFEHSRAVVDLDRTYCAFDGKTMVATSADFPLDLTVPGASLPMAGTTIVVVRPTHRRQGLLRQMMRAHIDATRQRGEPLAGLWASEAAIYGRFGFGPSTQRLAVEFDASRVGHWLMSDLDDIALVSGEEADEIVRSTYTSWYLTRSGALSRRDAWWDHRVLRDPEHWREGASARRTAVAKRDGRVVGYARYRQKEKFSDDWQPEGEVRIDELIALDGRAERSLWRFVSSIDLFPKVSYWNSPVDLALELQVTNHRAVKRTLGDALWVRLVDVPAAMSSRRYSAPGTVRIRVHDDFCPWNDDTYELSVHDDVATMEPTGAGAELEMDVAMLGAMYLGAHDPLAVLNAGRIRGEREAARRLGTMLRTSPAAWCPEVF